LKEENNIITQTKQPEDNSNSGTVARNQDLQSKSDFEPVVRRLPKFMLEIGQLMVTQKNYTYQRNAQATTYQQQWQQDSLCADINILINRFNKIYKNEKTVSGRIIDRTNDSVVWQSA